jgi:O-acetyl-ADP-ribose deacetylase (regulator of RNase III)
MGPDLRSSADSVRRATLATLRRAEELRLHSLAFPAFDAGLGRVDPQDSAHAMVSALKSHLTEVKPSSLQRIHLVLFQNETYQAFGSLLGLSGTRRAG